MAKKQAGIVIDNIGPIEHLELDAKPGTITVLRANNGSGKSTALDAIAALTRGEGKLESRDGTVGGYAEGFGVSIKVGRGGQNRRTGDLEVVAVEDRLGIADFVDPPVKDPVAADARRLKALISLVGLTADPTIFHSLAGGAEQFAEIVKPDSLKTSDPVELAERIKRDFEAASRIQNTKAERLFGEMKAKLAANEGIDIAEECDAQALQTALEQALTEYAAKKQQRLDADTEQQRRDEARKRLEESQTSYKGPTVEEARQAVEAAERLRDAALAAVDSASAVVQSIREQLNAAELKLSEAKAHHASCGSDVLRAKQAVSEAERHNVTVATWQKTLADDAIATAPTEAELNIAKARVDDARERNERGVLIRDAIKRKAEAAKLDEERNEAVKRSESLREAARSVLDVLASGVKSLVPGIILDNTFRIVVPHPVRTTCFYAELSHGERWKLALDIAVAAFQRKGERGVLAIPQEAWEALDGVNRKVVAEHVAKTDLIVFTAEAERDAAAIDANKLKVEVVA